MPWGQWARKLARGASSATGLDFNATRVRAVSGLPGQPSRTVTFEVGSDELPLALTLDGRSIDVGSRALAFRRQSPHQLCAGFLPFLGQTRRWTNSRQKLDANAALTCVVDRLRSSLTNSAGFVTVWPAYLDSAQVTLANDLLDGLKAPHLGSISAPLAAAIYVKATSRKSGIVLDSDDHAITWSIVTADSRQVRHLGSLPLPGLGTRAWVDRLMTVVADKCIQLCRRDPRDSAVAEQSLDDQLSTALASPRTDRPWQLSIRTEHWFQNMVFSAEDADRGCIGLARSAADGLPLALAEWPLDGPPEVVWVTPTAARLPGLIAAATSRLPTRIAIEELPAGAMAEAAQVLALRRLRGELCAGHIDGVLPREQPTERIHSR